MSESILFAPIQEIAAAYRNGTLSPVEVTGLALAQIERLNPNLNAFITVTADRALAAAHRAQEEIRAGVDRGLLHGIPVALKDLVDTAGIRTTCGSRILASHVPNRDAVIVQRLNEAGAVIVGKTNLLEFAYGIVHPDFGPTWNPWDTTRTAGGSSGGSAAAVAAGLCYAAVGTDTGGSIRIPAAYCGVAGFKPTYNRVSLAGVFPLSWSLDHAGPIARTSADAGLLFDALAGTPYARVTAAELQGLRLGVLTAHRGGAEMEAPVIAAFDAACQELERAGAKLVDITIPDLEIADGALMPIIGPEAAAIHRRWIREQPEAYAAHTRLQIELGFVVPALTHIRVQQYRRRLTGHFLRALEDVDAILSPTAPWVAPHEDPAVTGEEGASEARRTGPYNLTGLPALTINCGFDGAGLPIGLQIAGRPGDDHRVLGIGAAFERARPDLLRQPPLAR
ncbi:MAG: amidase [Caldilineaceae bacterium]|nr:amidase [Caldilineaceae bacterium]